MNIVAENVCTHTNGNTFGTKNQNKRQLRLEGYWFYVSAIVGINILSNARICI